MIRIFLVFILSVQLLSCGESEKTLAGRRLQYARSLYEGGDTVKALVQIDSILILHKRIPQEIAAAKEFRAKINEDLLFRKQDELDSISKTIEVLEKKFTTEKGEFDRYTNFMHKRQDPQKRWNKSFIQVHLNERGELSISSNYYGDTWLDHTGIRVYDGDIQAKTEQITPGNVLNHRSDFLETKWEKVSYTNGADNGVIDFIAQHAGRNLKAVFLGKRHYYIILEDYDKQAVIDALGLSKALKRKAGLEKEIKSLQSNN